MIHTQLNRHAKHWVRFEGNPPHTGKVTGILALLGLAGASLLHWASSTEDTFTKQPPPLGKYISDKDQPHITDLQSRAKQADWAKAEKQWAQTVQAQILTDMMDLYKAEAEGKVDVAIAEFTGPGENSKDFGYGPVLNVVKRFQQDMGEGVMKTTYVNEHWHLDENTGGLFAPEEIRVRTQVFNGERKVPGSEKLYIMDRFRVAWDEQHQASLHRETMYDSDPKTGENRLLQRRVPVGAPFNCIGCHSSKTQRFESMFLQPGETRNHEAITQDSQFTLAPTEQHGYGPYMAYVDDRIAAMEKRLAEIAPQEKKHEVQTLQSRIKIAKAIRPALASPEAARTTLKVENLLPALESTHKGNVFSWLGEDISLPRQSGGTFGVYEDHGSTYLESFETLFQDAGRAPDPEGRSWWDKKVVVPPQPKP